MSDNIQERIQEAIHSFMDSADLRDFLTEDDFRCLLFCRLQHTLSNHNNASLHAEVRWYGEKDEYAKELLFRSDLVVIDNRTLVNPTRQDFNVVSKGYGFDDYYAVIELKLRRPNDGYSDEKYYQKIQEDVRKLVEIRNRTENKNGAFYCVLLIDKKRGDKFAWILNKDNDVTTKHQY